jgi:hypothetical protein
MPGFGRVFDSTRNYVRNYRCGAADVRFALPVAFDSKRTHGAVPVETVIPAAVISAHSTCQAIFSGSKMTAPTASRPKHSSIPRFLSQEADACRQS